MPQIKTEGAAPQGKDKVRELIAIARRKTRDALLSLDRADRALIEERATRTTSTGE